MLGYDRPNELNTTFPEELSHPHKGLTWTGEWIPSSVLVTNISEGPSWWNVYGCLQKSSWFHTQSPPYGPVTCYLHCAGSVQNMQRHGSEAVLYMWWVFMALLWWRRGKPGEQIKSFWGRILVPIKLYTWISLSFQKFKMILKPQLWLKFPWKKKSKHCLEKFFLEYSRRFFKGYNCFLAPGL